MPVPNVGILITAKNMAGRGVNAAVDQLDRIRAAGTRVRSALFSAQGMLATFGLSIGAAAVTRFLSDTNRQTESLVAQLKVLEGSRSGAMAVFRQIEEFATKTPFQVDELTEAYIRLRTSGIQPTKAMMTSFGDLSSARSKSIVDFAMAVEDALTGEMERLKEFGIKARQSGDQVAFTFNGQTRIVRNSLDAIVEYLQEVGRSEVAQGSMAEQMGTLNGVISNQMDALGELARTIGDEGGVNDAIREGTRATTEFTKSIAENSGEVAYWTQVVLRSGKAIGVTIGAVVRLAWNLIQSAWFAGKAVLADANYVILGIVNAAIHSINFLIEQANRIPGVNIELFDTLDSTVQHWWDVTKQAGRDFLKQGKDMEDTLGDLASAWSELAVLATEAGKAQFRAMGGGQPRSWGGDNTNDDAGPGGDRPLTQREQNQLGKLDRFDPWGGGKIWMGRPGQGRDPDRVSRADSRRPRRGEGIADAIQEAILSAGTFEQVVADMVTGTIGRFGDAVTEAFANFVSGAEDAGEAFKSAMLGSLGAVAKGLGDFYAGKAVAAIAEGIALKDPSQFAAAAKYMAAATAMYAIAGGMAGLGGGGGAGGGAEGAAGDTGRLSGHAKGDATIVLQGSWQAVLADPDAQDSFAELLEELSDRRVVVRAG